MTTHADHTETAGSHAFPGWALAEWADHILEQAGVGVTIVDRNGSVLFYNKWAAETVADCIAQGRSAGTLHTLRHLWTRIL